MKNAFIPLICFIGLFLSISNTIIAQIDTTKKIQIDTTNKETVSSNNTNDGDDEFNLFLFTFASAFFCAIIIASLIGTIAAIGIILCIFSLVAAGVFSTSLVIGIYKKSFTAGFKSLLIIIGMITGTVLGIFSLWTGVKFFHVNLSYPTALTVGSVGGCIGGILMGLIIYKAIQLVTSFFKKKLHLTIN